MSLSGSNDGGGLGVSPGYYAEFVAAAVRSAMEPFLQNMAPVVGEQTAQITVVNQRVEQLASVVSQMNLNYSSNVQLLVLMLPMLVVHHLQGINKVVQV